jgi:hypothetical protein
MGGGLVAYPEYDFSSWYNPATVGLSEKVTTQYSLINIPMRNSYFNDFTVSYNSGKYGAIGISLNSLAFTEYTNLGTNVPNWKYELNSVNYSYQPVKNFFAGINLNMLSIKTSGNSGTQYPVDIGALKIFELPKSNHLLQKITLGSSLYNINNVKFEMPNYYNNEIQPLPVILRFGASYNIQYFETMNSNSESILNFLCHFEYENLLNSGLFTTYKAGFNINFIEILAIRLGYFTRKIGDDSDPSSIQHQITYGIGLKLPVSKWTGGIIPVNARLECSTIQQPLLGTIDRFYDLNTFNISVRWEKPVFSF